MLHLALIIVPALLIGYLTQRIRPDLSLLAASFALGWYLTGIGVIWTTQNWDTMLPLLQMTGDLGLDPDNLRMTILLTVLVSNPMPIFMIFLAAIFALLKVLNALYAPKLARAALWAYQGLAVALTLVMVANAVDNSAGSGWSLGGSNGITLLDLMKHGSAAVGTYAPIAFLIYATICIAIRLAKPLMPRPAARSKA